MEYTGRKISPRGFVVKRSRQMPYSRLASGIAFLLLLLVIPITRPFAVSLSGFVGFFAVLYWIIYPTQAWKHLKHIASREYTKIFLITLVFLFASGLYLGRYHFVPSWDSSGYWSATLQFNRDLSKNPRASIHYVISSINTYDYNALLSWIVSLPVRLFPDWASTFFIELVLAAVPTALLMASFCASKLDSLQAKDSKSLTIPFPLIYSTFLVIPVFLAPSFSGYLDGVVALLFSCIFVAVFDDDLPLQRWEAVGLGIGVAGTFLIRRWFIFGVIGLVVAAILFWSFKLFACQQDKRWQLLRNLVLTAGMMALSCLLPLLILFRDFVKRSFLGNYSNAYSAYNTLTLTGKLWNAACKIGWSWLIFSCICLILLIAKIVQLKSKKVSINGSYEILGLVASAALGSVVVFMTFWRVQDLDYQHWYAVVPFIESSIFLSIFAGILYIPKLMYLRLAESAVAILSVLSLCLGFSIIPSMGIVSNFIGVQLVAPKYQNDISEKGRFVDYLKKQTAGQSLVYFAAASFDLNADLPFNYSLPGSIEKPFPVATAGVDSRDGFNVDFFDAEYVVTSSPVALHMSPDKEQVVVALNNLVQDSSSYVGRHYKVLRQFSFDNSLIVTIYKKISSYEKADVRTLEQTFDRIYPDAPQLFKDRFEKVVANIEK